MTGSVLSTERQIVGLRQPYNIDTKQQKGAVSSAANPLCKLNNKPMTAWTEHDHYRQ